MDNINNIASLIIIVAQAVVAVFTIIEKSAKIKWKPISKLLGISDLSDKIDVVDEKVEALHKEVDNNAYIADEREMKRLKSHILEYANQKCEQGIKMTAEQEINFDEWCQDYEDLINKYNLTNGRTTQSIKLVSDYRKMELQDKYKNNLKSKSRKKEVMDEA